MNINTLSRVRAAEAGDRARVLEEFWQRKREALANKNRGVKAIGGPSVVSFCHLFNEWILFLALRTFDVWCNTHAGI